MKIISLFFISLLFTRLTFATICENNNKSECWVYNNELIKIDSSVGNNRRERYGDNKVPNAIKNAYSNLSQMRIPLYYDSISQATIKGNLEQVKDVIVQEFLRQKPNGMPYLPLSYTYDQSHAEETYDDISIALENSLSQLNLKNDDTNLLASLFVSNIPHATQSSDINRLRTNSETLAKRKSNFWDIRVEIHQNPSLGTLVRVKQWIARNSLNKRDRELVLKILNDLKMIFGNSSADNFRRFYNLNSSQKIILNKLKEANKLAQNIKTRKSFEAALIKVVDALNIASTDSLKTRKEIIEFKGKCTLSKDLNCRFKKYDYLRLINNMAFSISNLMYTGLINNNYNAKVNSLISIMNSLSKISESTGYLPYDTHKVIENFLSKDVSKIDELIEKFSGIDSKVKMTQIRLNGLLANQITLYSYFVKDTPKVVDETLRSSTVLPLMNFTKSIILKLQVLKGTKIIIGNDKIVRPFRVLNPGIAKGILYVPSIEDLKNPDFNYQPDGIYFLEKTPADLHKVEGVITADSGSTISHVQLLASNHGLPNIFVSKSLIDSIKKFQGKEVIIIALPNGEAKIKLLEDAKKQEIAAYRTYHQIKDKQKIRLHRPIELIEYNYPLRLEQLRLSHSGKVAGGKACGQGELSHIFPGHVPAAIVLPFGVYYDHMKKSGIYDEVKSVFQDQELSQDIVKRKKALKAIRDKIMDISIHPEVEQWLRETFNQDPFVDSNGNPRGVFVRSDTNAEDLPNFVGAGLNKTVPNIYGIENILNAIKTVWASPFKEKAISWRKDLIENPWEIYPSVIIQLSIDSTKAGVMVVGSPTNSDDITDSVFIATNEGVGISVVDGRYNAEENLYKRESNEIVRLRKSYATTKLKLDPKGGVREVPSSSISPILSDSEIKELSYYANTIQEHIDKEYGELKKWDMEWGIIGGHVSLFQIRSFIGNKIIKDMGALEKLSEGDSDKDIMIDIQSNEISLGEH